MRAGFKIRVCCRCHKPKGTLAFAGAYYHPDCFRKAKETMTLGRDKNTVSAGEKKEKP